MGRATTVLLPKNQRILEHLGENIRLARLRRKLSSEQLAQRAQMSRYSIWQIEKGTPGVSMGAYLQVLFVLGFEHELESVAANDDLGRKLQDIGLSEKRRAPKLKT
ncbi:MAG: helix-turn-helix transcriptional regulator [Bacteroidota bacterium]|nr:helix-turn-helix transcriptional regulator [Bacteroidota bacterium]